MSSRKLTKDKSPYNNIMLVDDNEIDNFINQKMIESVNLAEQIYTFSGGKSAFEYLKNVLKNAKSEKELLPELIFLDIDMPIMDGFQFLEHLNTFGDEVSDIRVIILTTSINPHDQEKAAQDKRVIRFVNKPLPADFLQELSSGERISR